MSLSSEAIQELHHLHQRVADLRGRLEKGPRLIAAGQTNVARVEEELGNAKAIVKRAKANCDERQLQLKSNESRIEDLRGKLNAANSNKEYQALKEQIAADEMANSVLADEILEMFDKIEEHEGGVKAVEERLLATRQELDKVTARVSDEKAALERDLADFEQRLTTAEKVLPKDFKAEYDRVVRAKGSEALAPLEGETCGSCNVNVTLQMVNDVMLARPVFCKSCGCLLYQRDPNL